VRLASNGDIDISSAYARGPGTYDVWAIRWAYGVYPAAVERDTLAKLIAEGYRQGFLFMTDADARPEFASDPRVNLWDDAATAVEFMKHESDVRRVALSRFGERNIRSGEPIALLQERFVPVYLMHRFAINSLSKTIGGMEYSNATRGDNLQATRPIPGAQQRAALSQLLEALDPRELAIPDTVLTLLAPRPFTYAPYVELFSSRTRPAFDELGAARTLASMIIDGILQRDRAGRLVQFSARIPGMLSLGEVIDSLVGATWYATRPRETKLAALQRVTERALADRLMLLAADSDAAPEVRAMADYKITALRAVATSRTVRGTDVERAHWMSIAGDFKRWLERQELPQPSPTLVAPPGDPFGHYWD
jgi:uncharacterized protein DUF4953